MRLDFIIVNVVTDIRFVAVLDMLRKQAEHSPRRPSSISSALASRDQNITPTHFQSNYCKSGNSTSSITSRSDIDDKMDIEGKISAYPLGSFHRLHPTSLSATVVNEAALR